MQNNYLLLGLLILVSSARQTNSDSFRDVLDSLRPDELVQRCINANIAEETKLKLCHKTMTVEYPDEKTHEVFMALVANCLISRMALGALFLKVTP